MEKIITLSVALLLTACSAVQVQTADTLLLPLSKQGNTLMSPMCIEKLTKDAVGKRVVNSISVEGHCLVDSSNSVSVKQVGEWIFESRGGVTSKYKVALIPDKCLRVVEVITNYGGSGSFKEVILVEFGAEYLTGKKELILSFAASFDEFDLGKVQKAVDDIYTNRPFWEQCL